MMLGSSRPLPLLTDIPVLPQLVNTFIRDSVMRVLCKQHSIPRLRQRLMLFFCRSHTTNNRSRSNERRFSFCDQCGARVHAGKYYKTVMIKMMIKMKTNKLKKKEKKRGKRKRIRLTRLKVILLLSLSLSFSFMVIRNNRRISSEHAFYVNDQHIEH